MGKHKKGKPYSEDQIFNEDLLFTDDIEILRCFEHFKIRYNERYKNDYIMTWRDYWSTWIPRKLGIYVPLTIIDVTDQKKKVWLYKETIKRKNEKCSL